MKHIHHWQLDSKSYGKCKCGAEKDFQVKDNKKTWWPAGKSAFETEFYNQGSFKLTRGVD